MWLEGTDVISRVANPCVVDDDDYISPPFSFVAAPVNREPNRFENVKKL